MDEALVTTIERALTEPIPLGSGAESIGVYAQLRKRAEHLAALFDQLEAVIVEDLRKTREERDRLLPFVIQRCPECHRVMMPVERCPSEKPAGTGTPRQCEFPVGHDGKHGTASGWRWDRGQDQIGDKSDG